MTRFVLSRKNLSIMLYSGVPLGSILSAGKSLWDFALDLQDAWTEKNKPFDFGRFSSTFALNY